MTEPAPPAYAFGPYRLLPAKRVLLRGDTPVVLTPKAFDILLFLIEHRDRVVSKDELLRTIWNDAIVEDGNLTQQVFLLRKALDDSAEEQQYIATIPRVGYRFASDAVAPPDEEGAADRRGIGRRGLAVAAVLLAVAMIAVLLNMARGERPATTATGMPRISSLVVLPLDNLSRDPDQQYFVDGMHEAIIENLGRSGVVGVISRTSARRYEGSAKSVSELARELNVDAVIEGSVLRVGDRVRIALRLIDARIDRAIWSHSYDRDLRDVLALQVEVARTVVSELLASLGPTERTRAAVAARARSVYAPDPAAYDAYLKGRYLAARGGVPNFRTAAQYYEAAITKDGTFAPAHAALAHVLLVSRPLRDLARAATEIRAALGLDPALTDAHTALGILRDAEWDFGASEAAFKRALELDPASSAAHQNYASLLCEMTRVDEALLEARRAVQLDPFSLAARGMVGGVLFNQHRYDEAIKVWGEILALDPQFAQAVYLQGIGYAMLRRPHDVFSAAERFDAMVRRQDNESGSLFLLVLGYALSGEPRRAHETLAQLEHLGRHPGRVAILYHMLGEDDSAFEWLERSYNQRLPALPGMTSEPWFDNVRDDPRFRALRARMGLP